MNGFELTLLAVMQLYGAQSRAIDTGDSQAWAETFAPDGCFKSPSYPEPVTGRESLICFAKSFTQKSPRTRHVITNAHITSMAAPGQATTSAYLMIVQTPTQGAAQILRLTTIEDELIKIDGAWKVARRQVILENKGQ